MACTLRRMFSILTKAAVVRVNPSLRNITQVFHWMNNCSQVQTLRQTITDRTLRTKPLRNHSTALSPICDFDNPKVLIQRLKLASQSGTGRKCNLQFPKVASRCKLFLCTACAEYLSHPRFMEKFGCLIHSENSHPFHFYNYAQLRERKEDPKKKKIGGFQCFEES